MVVLKTKEEAEAVKKKIDSGEITMYKAAAEYSIVPDARQTRITSYNVCYTKLLRSLVFSTTIWTLRTSFTAIRPLFLA